MALVVVGRGATSRGARSVQLDRLLIWEGTVPGATREEVVHVGLYGVFDGHKSEHGGAAIVAQLCQNQFADVLFAQAEWVKPAPTHDDIVVALYNTFQVLEGHALNQTRRLATADGCSACVLVARGADAWVCNVGDAHCVRRAHANGVHILTTDHTLANVQEAERVAGWAKENGRVMGVMATTRSIGDRDVKCDRELRPDRSDPVTWKPSIYALELLDKDELLIATRGLWTKSKGQVEPWCALAHERLSKRVGLRASAEALVDGAERASERADNVTAIVVVARRKFNGRLRSRDDVIDPPLEHGILELDAGITTDYHAVSDEGDTV